MRHTICKYFLYSVCYLLTFLMVSLAGVLKCHFLAKIVRVTLQWIEERKMKSTSIWPLIIKAAMANWILTLWDSLRETLRLSLLSERQTLSRLRETDSLSLSERNSISERDSLWESDSETHSPLERLRDALSETLSLLVSGWCWDSHEGKRLKWRGIVHYIHIALLKYQPILIEFVEIRFPNLKNILTVILHHKKYHAVRSYSRIIK